MKSIFLRAAALAITVPLLGGCVAAIIPVVASGALLGNEQLKSDGDEQREGVVAVEDSAVTEPVTTPAPQPSPVAIADEPIVEVQVAESPVEELPASEIGAPTDVTATVAQTAPESVGSAEDGGAELAATTPTEAPAVAPAAGLRTEPEPLAAGPVEVAMTPTPVPAKSSAPAIAPRMALPTTPTDFRAYDALYSYVDSQARRDPVRSPRQSAMLAVPGALSPSRVDCSIRPPAILLDLDPEGGILDPQIKARANPALGQILTSLRLQEIEVFWISKQPAIAAGAIRKALMASGLDPQGRDSLLLMRRAEDRKQARRKELSETHCLLAIGGDTRSDFDELYLYLKDQTAAQPLEELIGAGWFVTPLPLTEG